MSKLDDKLAEYKGQCDALTRVRGDIAAARGKETMLNNELRTLGEVINGGKIREASIKRRVMDLSAEVAQLAHSDAAGRVGALDPEPTPEPTPEPQPEPLPEPTGPVVQ